MKIMLLQTLVLIFFTSLLYGQADTVMVPSDINGDPFGAINKFIIGDTTDTGERANPDRYYKLEKNKIYFLDGIFFSNFDLRLIADDVEEGEVPPIVASTVGADGVLQLIQFKLFANGYIENIIFQMTPPSGNGESNASFFLSGEGMNYEFVNVRIEWGLWTGIVTEKPVNKIVVRDCYFRNPQHKTNIWNGRGVGFFQENPADSVIMQNNTFFNMNSFAFFADISSIPPDYLLFDHNTIVNSMKFPIHSFWLPNAVVTNNIFYNAHSYGENDDDRVGQDPDLLQYGIINIDKIPSDLIEYYGIEEGERRYKVENNLFYYADDIKTYWNGYSLAPTPFMNERVTGMFDDDANYPMLSVTNTIVEEDPEFITPGDGMTTMIQWMKNRRDLMGNTYWGWDPDGDKFGVQWPFPEDLSYKNETIKVASAGGFPLGDLNWWKEIKKEWEEWNMTVGVNDLIRSQIIDVTLAPNPANDNVTVTYELKERTDVSVSVYNLNGRKIAHIYRGSQQAGLHILNWSVSNSIANGIYLVRISDGNGSITKKIVIQN